MPTNSEMSGETNSSSTLTESQKLAIKQTWTAVYADAATNGLELFLRLFKELPHTKGYFEKFRDETDRDLRDSKVLKNHATKMMDGLNVLIVNLGNQETLVNEIQTLARDHKLRDVTSTDFKLVFEIFRNLMKEKLCEQYNDVVSESWRVCCDVIWNVIDAEMKTT